MVKLLRSMIFSLSLKNLHHWTRNCYHRGTVKWVILNVNSKKKVYKYKFQTLWPIENQRLPIEFWPRAQLPAARAWDYLGGYKLLRTKILESCHITKNKEECINVTEGGLRAIRKGGGERNKVAIHNQSKVNANDTEIILKYWWQRNYFNIKNCLGSKTYKIFKCF